MVERARNGRRTDTSADLAEIAEMPIDIRKSNAGEIVGNVSGQFVAPPIPRVTIFHPLPKLFPTECFNNAAPLLWGRTFTCLELYYMVGRKR